MTDYIFITILIGCSLWSVVTAVQIRAEFRKHGYEMKASPLWAWTNFSTFWNEATQRNERYNNSAVSKLLELYGLWWVVVAVASLLALIFNP